MIATDKEIQLVVQVSSDVIRHKRYREFAHPSPSSKLFLHNQEERWGYKPAREIIQHCCPELDLEELEILGAPWHVGYGFTDMVNSDTHMTRHLASRRLEELLLFINRDLSQTLTWYKAASFVTKTVLMNMYYDIGRAGLLSRKNNLQYIADRNYDSAAANMLKSEWAVNNEQRARELARRLTTQEIPVPERAQDKV